MRLLVTGGRNYENVKTIYDVLDQLKPDHLIHGGAPGADTIAGKWALSRGVVTTVYPAKWKTLGPAAGPLRNQQMLDEGKPEILVAFPGQKGTADMVAKAKAAKIVVIEVQDDWVG